MGSPPRFPAVRFGQRPSRLPSASIWPAVRAFLGDEHDVQDRPFQAERSEIAALEPLHPCSTSRVRRRCQPYACGCDVPQPFDLPMRKHFAEPFDAAVLHRRVGVEALGDGVGDDGLPFLLEQRDKPLLLLHQRVDLRRLAVEEGRYASLFRRRRESTGRRFTSANFIDWRSPPPININTR